MALGQQASQTDTEADPSPEIAFNHHFVDPLTYAVDTTTIRRNATSPWVLDSDPFSINQFLHPYQGSMYHGFARSAGLNYCESLAYTFAGSALWEIAGEATLPSRNDQIATGTGGTFPGWEHATGIRPIGGAASGGCTARLTSPYIWSSRRLVIWSF